ncbi:putative Late nodulin [Medicago truncatula]|uniref:Nodule Cysteine-Rich (NCR) secreted peptide n=1 Tax=Medicago truncatula TaxID=3880 RepID=A0A072U9K0_MEDTR|nr:Nodule Cysteine-Rich (NCR) secreted peptide [Medicago truncatula]RHN74407.1 putative Late nodulin [Medicago truncatula]
MAIIKFIYTMFLFILLFVVPTKVDGRITHDPSTRSTVSGGFGKCVRDADCVDEVCSPGCNKRCVGFECQCPL